MTPDNIAMDGSKNVVLTFSDSMVWDSLFQSQVTGDLTVSVDNGYAAGNYIYIIFDDPVSVSVTISGTPNAIQDFTTGKYMCQGTFPAS